MVVVALAAVVFLIRTAAANGRSRQSRARTREEEIAKAEARRECNEERQRIAKAAQDQRAAEAKTKTEKPSKTAWRREPRTSAKQRSRLSRWPGRPGRKTIKVGILHSLSGTLAISEIDAEGRHADADRGPEQEGWPARQEARGGSRRSGLELAAVRREGARADRQARVAAVFGCWTSVSRKSVLPVFRELNSVLFYPVQYEGEESERNVFYTGAAPNQQAIPAVD